MDRKMDTDLLVICSADTINIILLILPNNNEFQQVYYKPWLVHSKVRKALDNTLRNQSWRGKSQVRDLNSNYKHYVQTTLHKQIHENTIQNTYSKTSSVFLPLNNAFLLLPLAVDILLRIPPGHSKKWKPQLENNRFLLGFY